MTNLCIQVEDYVSPFASSLPSVAVEDLIYVEKLESDAYGHWLFGESSTSLTDKVNGRALTLQAGATATPEYSENFVRLGAAKGNALLSGLFDSDVNAFTISAVITIENDSLMTLFGNLGATDAPQGAGVFSSAGKLYATVRSTVSSLDTGILIESGKSVFASMSVDKISGTVNFVAMQNGVIYEKTSPMTTYVAAGTALAISNSRYTTSASYNTLKTKFYEVAIYSKALSLSEMKAAASRAKTRQQNRNNIF